MLGAKNGFGPSMDFVAQSSDLSFTQISKDSMCVPTMSCEHILSVF